MSKFPERKGTHFTCEKCKNKYEYGDEEEARKEYEENFPETQHLNDLARVCDDCYDQICEWIKSLSQKERMDVVKEAERNSAC